MALSGHFINFIDGLAIEVSGAANPVLDAIDITIAQKAPITIVWAGPLPTSAGVGLELRIPAINGVGGTFNLLSLFTRLSSAPTGTVQFTVEKSTSHGAFSAVSIGSTSHAAGDFEKTATLASTIAIGDLIRLNYTDMSGGTGGSYEVELTGTLQ